MKGVPVDRSKCHASSIRNLAESIVGRGIGALSNGLSWLLRYSYHPDDDDEHLLELAIIFRLPRFQWMDQMECVSDHEEPGR